MRPAVVKPPVEAEAKDDAKEAKVGWNHGGTIP